MAKDSSKSHQEHKTHLSDDIQQKTQFVVWNTEFLRFDFSYIFISLLFKLIISDLWDVLGTFVLLEYFHNRVKRVLVSQNECVMLCFMSHTGYR